MSMSISSTRRIIASSDGRRNRHRHRHSSSLLPSSTTLIMASAQLVTIIMILLLSVTNTNNNIVAVEAKKTTSASTASRRTTATTTPAVSSLSLLSPTTSFSFVTKTLRGGGRGIGRDGGGSGRVTKKVPFSRRSSKKTTTKTAAAADKQEKNNNDGASILTSIFNLSNNVAGAGILTLASGKATSGTGYLPSILICLLLAGLSSHTFNLVGKSCHLTGYNEFKDLWSYAFGANDNDDTGKDSTTSSSSNTSWIVDTMVFIQCFFVSIIYTGLLGDVFSALLKGTLGINQWYTSRTSLIVILSTCLLFPLNLIQDLSSLGFTSILGLLSVLYTVGFMVIRSMDGSYSIGSPNGTPLVVDGGKALGKFILDGSLSQLENQIPNFTKSTVWNIDINALVLISNLGLAFIAHYNAPSYWKSLGTNDNTKKKTSGVTTKSKSNTNNTKIVISKSQKFQVISQYSYLILAGIYVTTMICGYKTFGDISKGNILLNYSSNDKLALFGRLATGLSIIFGFPLISYGCREGLKNMCSSLHIMNGNSNGKSGNGGIDITNPKNHTILVLCLLCITTFCSIIAKDIGLVAGLTGAIMGSSLVYICPPLLYTKIIQRKFGGKNSIEYQKAKKNLLFIPFGIFTAIMGVIMTIKNAFFVE